MNNDTINYHNILNNLENQIKNNQFNSKENLNNYITYLKNNLISPNILTNDKILELLNLYDSLNKTSTSELNMQNYKGVTLKNQNIIINQQDNIILKTDNSNDKLHKEFKQIQNKITANNQNGLTNADTVFNYMKENIKEELNLISIEESINYESINSELLNKIKFFISNQYINPYSFKINLENELFYNIEEHSIYEVRKNEQTGKYEIYKGGEIVYGNQNEDYQHSDDITTDNQVIIEETNEEQLAYKNKNIKVRKRIKPNDLNNAAFAKSGLLFIIILFTSIIIAITLIN